MPNTATQSKHARFKKYPHLSKQEVEVQESAFLLSEFKESVLSGKCDMHVNGHTLVLCNAPDSALFADICEYRDRGGSATEAHSVFGKLQYLF
jgi:hypothetical protein